MTDEDVERLNAHLKKRIERHEHWKFMAPVREALVDQIKGTRDRIDEIRHLSSSAKPDSRGEQIKTPQEAFVAVQGELDARAALLRKRAEALESLLAAVSQDGS